jgi:hypothetical protein
VLRVYDRAKAYYTLVGLPVSEVVALAGDKPGRYSVAEWQALLQVRASSVPVCSCACLNMRHECLWHARASL